MSQPILPQDPGPVPEVVEPEPTEATLVSDVAAGQQVGVTRNWRHSGLTGLTLRTPQAEVTIPLAAHQVDQVCRLLAAACPIEALPGHLDPRTVDDGQVTVEQVHQVLAEHEVEVAWFHRRRGWGWWCGCLTDGTSTGQHPADAWQAAAWHQAEQVAAALNATRS